MKHWRASMRLPGYTAVALLLALALGAPAGLATSAQAATVSGSSGTYVALGDSYSSGEGLSPYQSATDTSGNTCHRSRFQAYPELISAADSGLPLEFHACSGAATGSYFATNPDEHHPSEPAQDSWLSSNTALVTMTFGGDNLTWNIALEHCTRVHIPGYTYYDSATCESDLGKVRDQVAAIKAKLVSVYTDVLARSPNARVRVLGYPPLFPDRGSKTSSCRIGQAPGLTLSLTASVERQGVSIENSLNADIKAAVDQVRAAAAGNSRLEYIDSETAFGGPSGHAITCGDAGAPTPWINQLTLSKSAVKQLAEDLARGRWSRLDTDLFDIIAPSFHPTATGQQKLAAAVTASLPK